VSCHVAMLNDHMMINDICFCMNNLCILVCMNHMIRCNNDDRC
jgi:hypothetical protein